MNKGALIIFTRIPVAGKVKTRLMPFLNGAECAALQKAMTLDTVHTVSALHRDIFVFHSDEGPAELLDGLPEGVALLPQSGSGLGERMYHALETVLATGYDNCLLMGSDLPFLTQEAVAEAGRVLEENDIALCPSDDGGYWLVGMHTAFRPVFEGQKYGTDSVLNDAMACCAAHGLHVGLGTVLRDLDTPEDLQWFLATAKSDLLIANSRTAVWLREWEKTSGTIRNDSDRLSPVQ